MQSSATITWFLVVIAVALTACDSISSTPVEPRSDANTLYLTHGTVLQEGRSDPQLCTGLIVDTLPPTCDGIQVMNWDWADVSGEQRNSGTAWGRFTLIGHYEEGRLEVVSVDPPEDSYDVGPIPSEPPPAQIYTNRELGRIQREAPTFLTEHFGIRTFSTDRTENYVTISVITASEDMRASLAEEYGEGVVHLVPVLREIDVDAD